MNDVGKESAVAAWADAESGAGESDVDGRGVGAGWCSDDGDGEEGGCGEFVGRVSLSISFAYGPPPGVEVGFGEAVSSAVGADTQAASGLLDDMSTPKPLEFGLESRHREVSKRKTSTVSWMGRTQFSGRIQLIICGQLKSSICPLQT
jgi:hypothetical protein